jgi:hypothetical protein
MNDTALAHSYRLSSGVYDVPCNGCALCCHNDAVRILPHEDATRWRTEPHPYHPLAVMLAHKPNGDCAYLGEHGCTIQSDKPQQCYEMDCRAVAQSISWTQARKLEATGGMRMAIWRRGRELMKERE